MSNYTIQRGVESESTAISVKDFVGMCFERAGPSRGLDFHGQKSTVRTCTNLMASYLAQQQVFLCSLLRMYRDTWS